MQCANQFASTLFFDTTSKISAVRVCEAGSQGIVVAGSVRAFVLQEAMEAQTPARHALEAQIPALEAQTPARVQYSLNCIRQIGQSSHES